MIPYLEY